MEQRVCKKGECKESTRIARIFKRLLVPGGPAGGCKRQARKCCSPSSHVKAHRGAKGNIGSSVVSTGVPLVRVRTRRSKSRTTWAKGWPGSSLLVLLVLSAAVAVLSLCRKVKSMQASLLVPYMALGEARRRGIRSRTSGSVLCLI